MSYGDSVLGGSSLGVPGTYVIFPIDSLRVGKPGGFYIIPLYALDALPTSPVHVVTTVGSVGVLDLVPITQAEIDEVRIVNQDGDVLGIRGYDNMGASGVREEEITLRETVTFEFLEHPGQRYDATEHLTLGETYSHSYALSVHPSGQDEEPISVRESCTYVFDPVIRVTRTPLEPITIQEQLTWELDQVEAVLRDLTELVGLREVCTYAVGQSYWEDLLEPLDLRESRGKSLMHTEDHSDSPAEAVGMQEIVTFTLDRPRKENNLESMTLRETVTYGVTHPARWTRDVSEWCSVHEWVSGQVAHHIAAGTGTYDATLWMFYSDTVDFLAAEVAVGDTLTITSGSQQGAYIVVSIETSNRLELDTVLQHEMGVDFTITRVQSL